VHRAPALCIEAVEPTLALFDQLRFEAAIPVAGHGDVELGRLVLDDFLALTITAVAKVTPVARVRRIPEVRGQLGLQGPLDEPCGQLPEQAMLAQDIFGVRIIFEEFIQ
jgi:hypothetical protein